MVNHTTYASFCCQELDIDLSFLVKSSVIRVTLRNSHDNSQEQKTPNNFLITVQDSNNQIFLTQTYVSKGISLWKEVVLAHLTLSFDVYKV